MSTFSPSIRKAAVLIRSLDSDSAAALLTQLSPSEAKAIRLAIRELGEVDPDEAARLADELRGGPTVAEVTDEPLETSLGVELELGSLGAASMVDDGWLPEPQGYCTPQVTMPFGWLEQNDLPSLAAVLEREHLSTVAVVLSHLPPDRASQLLDALPPGRRGAALERLADLGESDRLSLEVIEKGLADWISAQKAEQRRRADRLSAVRRILEVSTGETRKSVIADLAHRDKQLLEELGVSALRPSRDVGRVERPRHLVAGQAATLNQAPPTVAPRRSAESHSPSNVTVAPPPASVAAEELLPEFDFEQLASLRTPDTVEVFRNCDPHTLVLALAAGSDKVMHHIQSQLPSGAAKELARRVNHVAGVRLSDMARAQQEVAKVAARLKLQGKIAG